MGKFAQVCCNCLNRIPMDRSDWNSQPYKNRHHKKLSPRQREKIKIWEENFHNMYECGHHEGMLIQISTGEIIKLGSTLTTIFQDDSLTFEIYSKISNRHNYFLDDFKEEFHISPQEAELWLMEIEELEKNLLGHGSLPYLKVQKLIKVMYENEISSHTTLRKHLKSPGLISLLKNLDQEPLPPNNYLDELLKVLEWAKQLCKESIQRCADIISTIICTKELI